MRILLPICQLSLLVLWALPSTAAMDEPLALSLYAGAFDVGDFEYDVGEVGLEVRGAPRWRGRLPERLSLRPMAGAAGTTDGAAWIYAGLRADWQAATRWVVSPSFGVSLFEEGDGKELGGPVEFRSAIEAARRVGDRLHLGLAFYHLSNADLYDDNPGSNSLVLTLTTPLGRSEAAGLSAGRWARTAGRDAGRFSRR